MDDFIEETSYAEDTLFIGGGESEYIPVNHHVEILELFPRYDRIQKLYPEEVFTKILTLFFLRKHADIVSYNFICRTRFEYIEGAGHWVHSQKPAEFLDTITTFLNSLD